MENLFQLLKGQLAPCKRGITAIAPPLTKSDLSLGCFSSLIGKKVKNRKRITQEKSKKKKDICGIWSMSRILKSKLQFRIKSAFWWKWYTPMMHSKCWTVPAACSPVLCFCAHNQAPYACLCANENSSFARQRNLGEVLRGDNIVNTFYSVEIKCDNECELVCDKRRLSREECKAGGPVHPPYSSWSKENI